MAGERPREKGAAEDIDHETFAWKFLALAANAGYVSSGARPETDPIRALLGFRRARDRFDGKLRLY
jgi:hypothetical protein